MAKPYCEDCGTRHDPGKCPMAGGGGGDGGSGSRAKFPQICGYAWGTCGRTSNGSTFKHVCQVLTVEGKTDKNRHAHQCMACSNN